ncbi:hypothetical protein DITRI_Ditri11bG0125600 [Diplodiscus trichospermus]
MDNFPKVLCGWSWEENKLFELALAVVDEQHPDRWEEVAAMVGGEKSAEDVRKHYVILLEDLQFIESGKLDHKLGEAQSCIQLDCSQSVCWTDEDNKKEFHLEQLSAPIDSHAGSIEHKLIPPASAGLWKQIGYWWPQEQMSNNRNVPGALLVYWKLLRDDVLFYLFL